MKEQKNPGTRVPGVRMANLRTGAGLIAVTLAVSCSKGGEQEPVNAITSALTSNCSTFSVTQNVYDGPEYWGTITFKNNGSASVSAYKVEFDVPSGKHCTAEPESVPPGATLSPLTGSNPPQTVSNHCVFTWPNTPLAAGASKTFNYSTDSQASTPAANVVITDTVCEQPTQVAGDHANAKVDYAGDLATSTAGPAPGVPAGVNMDPTGGEGVAMPLGITLDTGGHVDVLRWSFSQESVEFTAVVPPPQEIKPCPKCEPADPSLLGGGLPGLHLERIHRPRAEAWTSSFGPGVFTNFDAQLSLEPQTNPSDNKIVLFDPESEAPAITFLELSAQDGDTIVDGNYHDATRRFASLVLYNASGGVEPSPAAAVRATATRQTGDLIKFDIINVNAPTATPRQGRLTAFEDRNGNAIAVTYDFTPSATDTQLGNDRKKLWLVDRITDAHGVFASLNYVKKTGTSRWVVDSINLPNSTNLLYQYGTDTANLDRLTQVTYPNGDLSQFSRTWDAASQTWGLSFKDAVGSAGVKAWKTVYVTGSSFVTPDSVSHPQEPNLVRRIVNNNGEQAYTAMEDPTDPNTTFYREGSNRLTRIKVDATGLPKEVARATTTAGNPLLATYTVIETYTGNAQGMIESITDSASNVRSYVRDTNTRAITTVNARGGTSATFTRNAFLQPTQTIDRAAHTTGATYDAKGNTLTITHGVGTPEVGTWTYEYNSRGQVTKLTDPNTKVTDYAYNAAGFLTSITEPADATGGTRAVHGFEYDAVGRLTASVDPNGRRTTFSYDLRGRPTTTTFPDASTELRTYGSGATAGLLTSLKDRNGNVEQYAYDASRRLTKITKASNRPEKIEIQQEYLVGTDVISANVVAGEREEFTYDERRRRVARKTFTVGGASLTNLSEWNTFDQPTIDTDPYGRRTFYVYDANNRLVRTVKELVVGGVPVGSNPATLTRITTPNPAYVIEEKTYNGLNQFSGEIDGRGVQKTYAYDGQGRKKEQVEAVGTYAERKTHYGYDPAGNLTRETLPRSYTEATEGSPLFETILTYTDRNLLKTKTLASGSLEAAVTTYTYTLTGKVATETDPRGGVTQNTYDACCDRVSAIKDPANFTTTFGYDAVGNRTSITNALGQATTFTYDGLNRRITERNPLGQTTTFTYDDNLTDGSGIDGSYGSLISPVGFATKANGFAVQRTNAAGETEVVVKDGARRTVLEIDTNGKATRTTYDTVVSGLVETKVTNPLGNSTKRRLDAAERARVVVDQAAGTTSNGFDATGDLVSTRDPNGVGKDCTFDEVGQKTSCTDTQGDTSSTVYDAAGNVVSTTNGEGKTTTCNFDHRNLRTDCTDSLGGTTHWAYDGNKNLVTLTDSEGKVTSYTYDARDLRSTATFPDSTVATDQVVYGYDGAGRLTSIKDQNGDIRTLTLDAAGRVTKKTHPDGKIDSFTYDAAGRLKQGSSGRYNNVVNYTYDGAGRTATESLTMNDLATTFDVTYAYDDANRTTRITYPNGTQANRTYNSRDLLSTVSMGTTLLGTFNYDGGGRVSSLAMGNGLTETRTYRSDDRLSSISTGAVGNFTYTYDKNKWKHTEGGSAVNGPQSFGYDDEGRPTSWNNGTSTQSWILSLVGDWLSTTRNGVVETRTHNAAHELTAVGSAGLTYDPRGNLVQDDQGNVLAWDFENQLRTYIPSGQSSVSYLYDALGRRVGRKKGSTTRVFVHSASQVIAEYDNTTLAIKYFHGDHIDRPIAYWFNGDHYWYSGNHLGSVGAVSNDSGAVVERYRYDAHGTRTILSPTGSVRSSSTVANQIGYTGRYHDKETGLVHFRFRDFHPRLGRFISRDDSYHDGSSLYRAYFVPNGTDPTGHDFVGQYDTPDEAANAALDAIHNAMQGDPGKEYGTGIYFNPDTLTYSYDDKLTPGGTEGTGIADRSNGDEWLAGTAHGHPRFVQPSTDEEGGDTRDTQGQGSRNYVEDYEGGNRKVYEDLDGDNKVDRERTLEPEEEDPDKDQGENSTPPCDDEDNDGQCDEPEGSGS
jgi:RHS repeat-associated protein